MANAQSIVDRIRRFVSEPDKDNSRWTDQELLAYYNEGRKAFARKSKAIKVIFERTTTIGATPGNTLARYTLDPKTLTIDFVYWDNQPVHPAQDATAWNARFDPFFPARQGVPFMYRRFGDALDLYAAPNDAKLLEIFTAIIPEDLADLDTPENRLKDDHIEAAARWASGRALFDDDRDGSTDLAEFDGIVRVYNKLQNKRGPRYVATPTSGQGRYSVLHGRPV